MRVIKGIVRMQHKFNIIANPFMVVNSKLFENHNSVTSNSVTFYRVMECNWLVMEWKFSVKSTLIDIT